MKKLSLLLAIVFLMSSFSIMSAQADTHEITFFTNDEHLKFWSGEEFVDSLTYRFENGHVIEQIDIPRRHLFVCGGDYELEWVENPVGYVVEKDMAFEMYIANKPDELADVRFYGEWLLPPGWYEDWKGSMSDMTISYPVGYTLTLFDLPSMTAPRPGGGLPDLKIVWNPEPLGATVYGGEEFESHFVEVINVEFLDPHYEPYYYPYGVIRGYYDIEYGTIVELPTKDEIPQYPGEVFIGWDSDAYLYPATEALEIFAEYRYLGDANTDGVVNSGDAAYILRHALGLTKSEVHNFDELADYNCDGAVNTGDAAGVLAFAVNG